MTSTSARYDDLNTATSVPEWDAGCRFDFENPEYR